MEKSNLSQMFFIYRDSVVTELASTILSKENIKVYGLNAVNEDFSYIINDLNPELVLVDEAIYVGKAKEFIDQSFRESKSEALWVYLSEESNPMHIFHLSFKLPIKAKSLKEDLEDLVAQKNYKN